MNTGNLTFTIIKPNSVASGDVGRIIDRLICGGFVLRALRMLRMERARAEQFYAVHRERPFFDELTGFMTSGPVVVALLEGEDAVARLRSLVGNTDPALAEQGTIRRDFGLDKTRNAIHASDSDLNAAVEWQQFFTEEEINACTAHQGR
ncbi:MAG: nucleoside-diphosphate kinase [Rikenellaceae bacterium]|jgi:nucleoside-diphosphate kinase|nr:nucleoside-diphosphate kinase [Rikenellaceae bacterium]